MDIQQAINLRLHRELTELEIEFAYPTQKLYVVGDGFPRTADDESARGEARSAA